MLGSQDLVAFVAVTDLARARAFYEGILGLTLVDDTPIAIVFDAHGTTLRVTLVDQLQPPAYTVLGWRVDDIAACIGELVARGVSFNRYDGMDQDELGVWTPPGGAQVAWFYDPEGNNLSLTQEAPRDRS
jgi:catechol 2,3-dioxygenase-like lactoylglutathione lyase family enzyme